MSDPISDSNQIDPVDTLPDVSVCLAIFNRADFLKETLDSLLNQQNVDFEIVAVNDGSTDPRVAAILNSYTDPRLRIIFQSNTGFTTAIRRAVGEARGKYVAIQGTGDASLPGRLSRQKDILDQEPDVGLVSCRQENVTEGGHVHGQKSLSRLISLRPTSEIMCGRHNPLIHGEAMFRRTIYDKVGGYRTFFTFAQDRDLWLRMSEHCGIVVLDEILYKRRHFFADGVNNNGEKFLQQRAFSLFGIQCYRDRQKLGQDMLERYGHSGYLFRRRNKSLANFAAERALECLIRDNRAGAALCSRFSLDEYKTLRVLLSFAVVHLALRSNTALRLLIRLNELRRRIRDR
ncbi:MAG TPA: glycosyltransferase [Sphingomonas sp.]|jgi:hypothetical protein|nr:glycosyltransferase [Sphingomonas sp.]